MAQSVEVENKQSLLKTTILLGVIEGRNPHGEIAMKNVATAAEVGQATRKLLADRRILSGSPTMFFPRPFVPGVEYQFKPSAR